MKADTPSRNDQLQKLLAQKREIDKQIDELREGLLTLNRCTGSTVTYEIEIMQGGRRKVMAVFFAEPATEADAKAAYVAICQLRGIEP